VAGFPVQVTMFMAAILPQTCRVSESGPILIRMTRKTDNAPARQASRITYAQRRFDRYLAEMRLWGLEVTVTGQISVPPEK
jgi:hypothetical protein